MGKDELSIDKISKIAQEVIKGYDPRPLPSLEQISWAFPIGKEKRMYYTKQRYVNRILNTQEGEAMRELMTLRNFDNVLKYLSEGRDAHHTLPTAGTEDGAYMVWSYLSMIPEEQKKERLSNLTLPRNKGFFWETIPESLVKTVLRAEGTGRGKKVDEWGRETEVLGKIAYIDSGLTKEYLQNMRRAYELGSEHFNKVLGSNDQAENYPQLKVDNNVEIWKPGDEFQWAYGSENEPLLAVGKVVSNNGSKLELAVGEKGNIWDNIDVNQMREFAKAGMLWKLIPPKS